MSTAQGWIRLANNSTSKFVSCFTLNDGSVYTFSVIMQSRHPAFAELGPYAVAYVDLDEGFRIMTNVVGVNDPVNDVTCGMRVKLVWQDQGDGDISLPMFEPA